MNKKKTMELLVLINSFYGNQFKFPKESTTSSKIIVRSWHDMLKDLSFEKATELVKRYNLENPQYPPSPGHILRLAQEENDNEVSPDEAWYMLNEAISSIGWSYNPDKVREKLPHLVIKAGEMLGMSAIAYNQDNYLEKKYKDVYRNLLEEKRKGKQMELLEGQENKNLLQGESQNDEN